MSTFALFQKALADRLDPSVRKPLAEYAESLRRELRQLEQEVLAQRSGAEIWLAKEGGRGDPAPTGELLLSYWGELVQATLPELVFRSLAGGRLLDDLSQALLLHYFQHSDGVPASGSWIAFSELPNARFYDQAFQGYTGRPLAQHFGQQVNDFAHAAGRADGAPISFADCAFAFQPLPRVSLLAACWLGDEDFPASYRILFDAAVPHHLSTDACAILGSMLTRRLLSRQVDKWTNSRE